MKALKIFGIVFIAFVLLLTTIYLGSGRIVKYFKSEPYPIQTGEFMDINYADYITQEPVLRYEDYQFSAKIYDIRDYGAIEADFDIITDDIILNNTLAINNAIDDCALMGGVVLVPQGKYIAGTIQLKSNITLRIEGELCGSHKSEHYEPKNFIIGDNVNNVLIEGPGKIMGEGEYFWKKPVLKPLQKNPKVSDVRMLKLNHFLAKREKLPNRPSPFIKFAHSENINIRNIIIENSPGWTLVLESSNLIEVRDIVINNNLRGGNVDGIDIVGSSNVIIYDSIISTADDAIVLKNPKLDNPIEMLNIEVYNVKLITTTNCFKIGTETYGDISNVVFRDSEIYSTTFYPGAISGIAIESVDGARVSNIQVDNIIMEGILAPIFIRVGNRNKYGGKDMLSSIDNVVITNVEAINCQLPSIITGVKVDDKKLKATNIYLSNLNITYLEGKEKVRNYKKVPEYPDRYPDAWMFNDVPAYGLYIRHSDVITSSINVIPRSSNKREKIIIHN